jgi:hypothetical protein
VITGRCWRLSSTWGNPNAAESTGVQESARIEYTFSNEQPCLDPLDTTKTLSQRKLNESISFSPPSSLVGVVI